MSLLARGGTFVAIGRVVERAALALPRRVLILRRRYDGRGMVWRLHRDTWTVEGSAIRPGHCAFGSQVAIRWLATAPVSGGTKRGRF